MYPLKGWVVNPSQQYRDMARILYPYQVLINTDEKYYYFLNREYRFLGLCIR